MIEFTEDKTFKIKNWEKHQNVEGMERLRNENSRSKTHINAMLAVMQDGYLSCKRRGNHLL
jgi:hypothetical protein